MQIRSDTLAQKNFDRIVSRFQVDSSCLTIDNVKPELCPNSAPLYNIIFVVDNSILLFFHPGHVNCNDNKFNPLSTVFDPFSKLCNQAKNNFSCKCQFYIMGTAINATTNINKYMLNRIFSNNYY